MFKRKDKYVRMSVIGYLLFLLFIMAVWFFCLAGAVALVCAIIGTAFTWKLVWGAIAVVFLFKVLFS